MLRRFFCLGEVHNFHHFFPLSPLPHLHLLPVSFSLLLPSLLFSSSSLLPVVFRCLCCVSVLCCCRLFSILRCRRFLCFALSLVAAALLPLVAAWLSQPVLVLLLFLVSGQLFFRSFCSFSLSLRLFSVFSLFFHHHRHHHDHQFPLILSILFQIFRFLRPDFVSFSCSFYASF